MPSLHFGTSVMAARLLSQVGPGHAAAGWAYALSLGFGLVYLGERSQALLRPLFMLSFLVDDFLAENEFFGAKRVLLSSASSKTAYGLAHLVHARGIRTIGLTSA